ncbi:MAG: fibronectin type III domain-containing protein [Candidatus Thiodiazotropha sp.]
MHHLPAYLLICLLLLCSAASMADTQAPFTLHLSSQTSNDGRANLSWNLEGDAEVQIQQAGNPGFSAARVLYQGTDRASVVTGLPDGAYHYRGRWVYPDGSTSPWGEAVTLQVTHHSLMRAGLFFAVGALVFIATTLLILTGNRRQGASP